MEYKRESEFYKWFNTGFLCGAISEEQCRRAVESNKITIKEFEEITKIKYN